MKKKRSIMMETRQLCFYTNLEQTKQTTAFSDKKVTHHIFMQNHCKQLENELKWSAIVCVC